MMQEAWRFFSRKKNKRCFQKQAVGILMLSRLTLSGGILFSLLDDILCSRFSKQLFRTLSVHGILNTGDILGAQRDGKST